jgi:hypothetical protein
VDERLPAVLAEIRTLVDLPSGARRPSRAVLENTLTTGYAYALGLEGERVRIERRLRALLRGTPAPRTDEVARVRDELTHAERELADVRELLSTLRAHLV